MTENVLPRTVLHLRTGPSGRDRSAMSLGYDVECAAHELYAMAGEDDDRPIWPPEIAAKILGSECIERADRLATGGLGALFRVRDQWRIYVRRGLPDEAVAHVVGHELGHWICKRDGYEDENLEEVCDAIGAALVAPRRAFATAIRALGDDLPSLAETFVATESLVALRLGEVTGRPLALVAPTRVRVRGQLSFEWGTEYELRRLARGRARPGLRKVALTDDRRRVALMPDEALTG